MITLRADNRKLLESTKYSFLVDNYSSGTLTIGVTNVEGFSTNNFVLLGNFGSENTEIMQVSSINTSTQEITFSAATKFPHSESTKATSLAYSKVRFFYTPTAVYNDIDPLTGYIDVQANDWFSMWDDELHSNGFGWFIFHNPITLQSSQPSNPIPYSGFALDTVKKLFDATLSLLNNKELKLVNHDDLYTWANEGYEKMRNELNMVNHEYGTEIRQTISILPGVSEYALPADFGDLMDIVDDRQFPIGLIPLSQMLEYTQQQVRYYIRGHYIGFVPIPTTSQTFMYSYITRAPRLSSYDDIIDLPDGGFYSLKDFLVYRAKLKTENPNAAGYFKIFTDGMNNMKIYAIKRDANSDSWSILPSANV